MFSRRSRRQIAAWDWTPTPIPQIIDSFGSSGPPRRRPTHSHPDAISIRPTNSTTASHQPRSPRFETYPDETETRHSHVNRPATARPKERPPALSHFLYKRDCFGTRGMRCESACWLPVVTLPQHHRHCRPTARWRIRHIIFISAAAARFPPGLPVAPYRRAPPGAP